MRLAEQWAEILADLPPRWTAAHLLLDVEDEGKANRAAVILGPASAGRAGATRFRVDVHRGRGMPGPTPEVARRCFQRLDQEGVPGRVELVAADAPGEEEARGPRGRSPLAAQWNALLDRLPSDWSDLYAEVELDSSDFLVRGALLLAPVNPAPVGGPKALRFRCAKSFGYGVAPEMARRCLERLDGEGITGRVRALRVLSDTAPSGTQGPVFRIGGQAV